MDQDFIFLFLFLVFILYIFPLPFNPFLPPAPCNHLYESHFPFAQSLHPLTTSPPIAVILLSIYESVSILLVCYFLLLLLLVSWGGAQAQELFKGFLAHILVHFPFSWGCCGILKQRVKVLIGCAAQYVSLPPSFILLKNRFLFKQNKSLSKELLPSQWSLPSTSPLLPVSSKGWVLFSLKTISEGKFHNKKGYKWVFRSYSSNARNLASFSLWSWVLRILGVRPFSRTSLDPAEDQWDQKMSKLLHK